MLTYLSQHQYPHLLRVLGGNEMYELALNRAWEAAGMHRGL